ncbi:MAG: PEP-CTERM sorting domain-containing protein, partial [Cyanobacteria bacterium]|nr:PEP-CTERM sorting domain-containing protein [Cyanobacteriota bacterium]
GFTTDGNITGIKLTLMAPVGTEYNRVVLDNFAYATAAGGQTGGTGGGEIPEPTTYLLCAAGLLGIALSRKSHSLKI